MSEDNLDYLVQRMNQESNEKSKNDPSIEEQIKIFAEVIVNNLLREYGEDK